MRAAWLVTIAKIIGFGTVLMGAASGLGCSVASAEETSDDGVEEQADALSAAPKGLWVLEGSAQSGDIELLQLDRRDHASLVRGAAPSHAAAPGVNGARSASSDAASQASSTTASGPISRSAGTTTLVVNGKTYSAATVGDTLKLTPISGGDVLTFKRSFGLYCVPDDPGIEATLLVEMGASPKLVAVNGNGVAFPSPGEYTATTRTPSATASQQKYVIQSAAGGKRIELSLPWSQMTKANVKGSIALKASTGPATTTPIRCERFAN